MKTTTCPICAYTLDDANDEIIYCPVCGTDLIKVNSEKIIRNSPGTYTMEDKQFFGKMSANATIILTNQHFLVIPEKLEGFNRSTVLTASIMNKITSNYGVVSVPITMIKEVRDGKFGLLGKALIVETKEANVIKITAPKLKEWKEVLSNTLQASS